ncbi:PREDICTED: LOB domain-containing protein 16-like [Camelina sativa]|uniref:LOB domain-containing protein 16-like n=1 Tax=Camelina sativa TaxID=90675 RepID=A0ABM0TKH2_CAMSA|nr:PREDICTED: LOB domain-containing protein 16-like [Camelina sativa]
MASNGTGTGSPCGACKFLRRKCVIDCIFAPYFSSEESPARFAAIHKVFGASNVSKILLHVPIQDRHEVVVTMAYQAEARLHDPVYGCVSHVFALQQQVAFLQAQLMQLKANLAHQTISTVAGDLSKRSEMMWQQTSGYTIPYMPYSHENPNKPVSVPLSSIESLEYSHTSSEVTTSVQDIQTGRFGFHQDGYPNKKRSLSYCNSDLGELQALARMMRN